jgi:hypothetical protein
MAISGRIAMLRPNCETLCVLISATDVDAAKSENADNLSGTHVPARCPPDVVGKRAQITAEDFSLCNGARLRRVRLVGEPP